MFIIQGNLIANQDFDDFASDIIYLAKNGIFNSEFRFQQLPLNESTLTFVRFFLSDPNNHLPNDFQNALSSFLGNASAVIDVHCTLQYIIGICTFPPTTLFVKSIPLSLFWWSTINF